MKKLKKLLSNKMTKIQMAERVQKIAQDHRAVIELADMVSDMDQFARDYDSAKSRAEDAAMEVVKQQRILSDTLDARQAADEQIKDASVLAQQIKNNADRERVDLLRETEAGKQRVLDAAQVTGLAIVEKATNEAKEASDRVIRLRGVEDALDAAIKDKQLHLAKIVDAINVHKQAAVDAIEKLEE